MVWVPGPAQSGVVSDEAFAIEIVKAVIHKHHTILSTNLDRVFKLMNLVFADEISDRAIGDY